jgi:sulfatase modifying factor 1
MKRALRTVFIIAIITMMGATAGETAGDGPNFIDAATGMEFVFVKGGCFQMGDTFGDGIYCEKPVHEVCVNDFYMGKYEVTQGQWKKVMGNDQSEFRDCEFKDCGDNCPVETVSWNDTQKFISKLNSQSDKNYRLPTEAEWEYAARSGGKKEKWAGTSDESSLKDYAWFHYNSGPKTHPVGQKKPNGLGIYDMSGNVREWCSDWYGAKYYGESPRDNPRGPGSGEYRVLRGGAWNELPWPSRAAHRLPNTTVSASLLPRGSFLSSD